MSEQQAAFVATPVQVKLMDTVRDGRSRIIGFGGGVRGTKTWGSLAVFMALCRIFPGSRWAIIRKDLQRLRDTTIPSFDRLREKAGGFVGPINQQTWDAECRNGSRILFRGENIDKDPELLRFHGYEVNGFLNEEADELSERTLVKEIERAGTWICEGEQPPQLILNTFNPCANWPRRRFYVPWRDKTIVEPYAFIPTTQADNPYISDEQRKAWLSLPEHEYNRFVKGDWESLPGGYYDALTPEVFIDRSELPEVLPEYWRYWGSYDWGYAHWSVMSAWATDEEGTDFLLDTVWLRRMQDDELAIEYARDVDPRCLREVYSGHDVRNVVKAHGASAESVQEVFAKKRINLVLGDIDKVNGGRAVNRQLKAKKVRIVRTPGNVRVYDQLAEILPDPDDVRKPLKVDADPLTGVGGDDGADCFRYGIATRVAGAVAPKGPPSKTANVARRLEVKEGKLVEPEKEPTTIEGMEAWLARRRRIGRTVIPPRPRVPKR